MASLPRAHARSARASRLDLPGTVSHINDYLDQQGWTDGLPIIPPTAEIAAARFGRKEIKEYIFGHARMPLRQLRDRGHWGARSWPEAWEHQPEDFLDPLITDPKKLILVVAGGDGRHSSWFPAWSATQRAIEVIAESNSEGRGASALRP